MKTLIRSAAVVIGVFFFWPICTFAQGLTIPHTFAADTPAVAQEVNENFSALKTAVDDHDARIITNLSYIDGVVNIISTQTISIPAGALGYDPSGTIITLDYNGLLWQQTYASSAVVVIKAPADYNGNDVTFSILFSPDTSASGVVDFFIRPSSYNSGDDIYSATSLNANDPVSVSGSDLTVYEQVFTIPADRLANDWWRVTIQRQGSSSTYTDDVVVRSVAFEYSTLL